MVLGITGGVGCGKSNAFVCAGKEKGCKSDLGRQHGPEVMERGRSAMSRSSLSWAAVFWTETGHIKREKMAQIIYGDDEKRRQVNEIVHPSVKKEIKERIRMWQAEPLVVVETALMFESGCDAYCDEVWGIFTDPEIRIDRLLKSSWILQRKVSFYYAKADVL